MGQFISHEPGIAAGGVHHLLDARSQLLFVGTRLALRETKLVSPMTGKYLGLHRIVSCKCEKYAKCGESQFCLQTSKLFALPKIPLNSL